MDHFNTPLKGVRYHDDGATIYLSYAGSFAKRIIPAVFLAFWLTGWTAGCTMLVGQLLANPNLFLTLFAMPFLAAWIAVVCGWLCLLFGKVRVKFDSMGVERQLTCLIPIPLTRKFTPINELEAFKTGDKSDGGDVSSGLNYHLEAVTINGEWRLVAIGNLESLYEVSRRMNDRLTEYQQQFGVKGMPLANQYAERLQPEDAKKAIDHQNDEGTDSEASEHLAPFEITKDIMLADPPSDSRWQTEPMPGGVVLLRQGEPVDISIAGTFFFAVFWNGIVSVFLVMLIGSALPGQPLPMDPPMSRLAWWGLCLFLIPFELIGLCLIFAFLSQLLSPFRRERWEIGFSQILYSRKVLGVGRSTSHAFEQPGSYLWQVEDSDRVFGDEDERQLVLIGKKGLEFFTFDDVTKGDARWIAGQIDRL